MAEAKQGSIERTWLIRDGHVVVPEWGVMEGDVFIEDGVIAAIGRGVRAPAGVPVYDASGKHVFPGFIDPHVHLGNFNRFEDDCRTETISAAAGGITTIVNYLKILRHRPTQESYERIFDEVFDAINTTSAVDVALHCVLSTPQHTQEIPLYARRGIPSFKFYLGYKGSEKALKRGAVAVDDGIIFSGFSEAAAVGDPALVCIHAENEEVVRVFEAKIPDKNKATFLDWANSRPNLVEAESVTRGCYFAEVCGAPIYLVHLSSKEGLAVAKAARQRSPKPVYVETCTHYLLLTKEDGNRLPGATAKIIPPLREQASVDAYWEGIRDGSVACVGTDHCALRMEQKRHVWDGDPAFPGMETFAPLMLTEGRRRGIPVERISQVSATNAARIFGLYPKKGTLQPGSDGDVAVVNLNARDRIQASRLHGMSGFTPYEGMETTAVIEATWLRGHQVYTREKDWCGQPSGQVLLRPAGKGSNAVSQP
jgi:dihydropyrimidinase